MFKLSCWWLKLNLVVVLGMICLSELIMLLLFFLVSVGILFILIFSLCSCFIVNCGCRSCFVLVVNVIFFCEIFFLFS